MGVSNTQRKGIFRMVKAKKQKQDKPKKGWFYNAHKEEFTCDVGGNAVLKTKYIMARYNCPQCGVYGLIRVYLHQKEGAIIPSLRKFRRCQGLRCQDCRALFCVTVECHPDCSNRVGCLTHAVILDLTKWVSNVEEVLPISTQTA